MEDTFKKAQKPWVKLLQKVDKAKSDYHIACKTERSASNQERNASGDSSVSPDQVIFLYKIVFDPTNAFFIVAIKKAVSVSFHFFVLKN